MKHNCDNCQKDIQRKVFCTSQCSRAYYNKMRHNVSQAQQNTPKVIHNVSMIHNASKVIMIGNNEDEPHTRSAHRTMNEEAKCPICSKE